MKTIKPQRLGALMRTIALDGRTYRVATGALARVPLANTRSPMMETSLWRVAADHIDGAPDEAYAKPNCEVLLSGSVVAPEGQKLTVAKPRLIVEREGKRIVDKAIAVFGNRYWTGRGHTEPEPFSEMPLRWSRSFGGDGHEHNPGGLGFATIETEHGPLQPLPNIEDPKWLVVSPDDRPTPVGLGPIGVASPMRMRHAGKDYGGDWLETRFPGPALDFDARFFQAAPEDQQLATPWTGTETIRVEGMVPGPPVEGTLTPLVVKALVGRRGKPLSELEEHRLRLETVHVLPNERSAILIYRGLVEVEADDADDIAHLMLAAESPDQPKPIEHYRRVLAGRLDKDRSALFALKDDDLMPPADEGWVTRPDFGEHAEMLRSDQRGLGRAERGRKAKLAAAQEELRAAGFEGFEEAFAEPDIPAPPTDPYDVDALLLYTEQMEAFSSQQLAEAEAEKEKAEKEARRAFEEAGFDYDAEMARAAAEAAGPPDFSADQHLTMLHDMARIASEGGQPMIELENDLMDEDYVSMMHDLEKQVRDTYRLAAHLMPPAPPLADDARQHLRVVVQAAKDGGEPLAGRNLTGADLSRMDLSGLDLSGAILEGADLNHAKLIRADLRGAVLTRANLTDASLFGADLRDANLGDTALVRTDFCGSDLRSATLMRSRLVDVQLGDAQLEDASFFEATLDRVLFVSTKAPQLLFYKSDLRTCIFTDATLEEARFIECDLRGTAFDSAALDRAQFIHCHGRDADFARARLAGATFVVLADNDAPSDFDEADFTGADLTRANLQGLSLRRARLSRATLTEANLRKTRLDGADLDRASARGALMMRTSLAGASLARADLLGALLQKADLRGADLRGANLSRSDLGLAWLDEATRTQEALMIDTKTAPARRRREVRA